MDNSIHTEIENTFTEMISLLSSLDEKQLNKTPFEDSWTAGQLADHLRKSYDAGTVLKGKTEVTERAPDEKEQEFKDLFLNFDIKMKSPDFITPTNEHISKDKMINDLKDRTSLIVDVAKNEDLTLTCLDFKFPNSGHLTRYEWISFMNVHTIRHIHQLKNIIKHLD